MAKKGKVIALILGLSIFSSATYGSYAYFKGEHSFENTVKIAELDSKDSPFEIANLKLENKSLVLEFSKRVFYEGDNLEKDILGSGDFLKDSAISIEDKSIIIEKNKEDFIIPTGVDEELPSLNLKESFKDRFDTALKEIDLYLYKDDNGEIKWLFEEEYKKVREEIDNKNNFEQSPKENSEEVVKGNLDDNEEHKKKEVEE